VLWITVLIYSVGFEVLVEIHERIQVHAEPGMALSVTPGLREVAIMANLFPGEGGLGDLIGRLREETTASCP
jgi:hypothetical protein